MNQSATILVSNPNKNVDQFHRIVVTILALCLAGGALFFIFEDQIHRFLISYLPMGEGKTPAYYNDLFRVAAFELWWIAATLVIALLFYRMPRLARGVNFIEEAMVLNPPRFIASITVAYACIVLIVTFVVLEQFPNSSDEYVYLYQAQTLRDGKLWDPSHPIEKSFGFNHIAIKDGIMVGRFPPGWPLVIALITAVGIPASLVNPLLSIVAILVFHRLCLRKYGAEVAGWATLMLAFTSFFIFNAASYFSHVLCVLATLLFVSAADRFALHRRARHGLLAGVCLGIISTTRYYTAFLLFFPFLVVWLHMHGWKSFRFFLLVAIGAAPFFGLLLWYNYAITGNPVEPVTMWGYKNEALGFVNGHTPLQGVEHILRRIAMFVYWCSPVLLALYFVFLIRKISRKASAVFAAEDYFFIALMVGYFFYYEIGGNQYGPRFYFEAFPFLVLFVVVKVFRENNFRAKVLIYATIVIALVKLPVIAWRENRIVRERTDVYRIVEEKGIRNAVVLLSAGTGVLRPMPSGDLTRNDIHFKNRVLYAIDHPEANARL